MPMEAENAIFRWLEVEYLFFKRATNFNFDEHIHLTPSKPLNFSYNGVVHDRTALVLNFYDRTHVFYVAMDRE